MKREPSEANDDCGASVSSASGISGGGGGGSGRPRLSRDERKAREMGIPFTVHDIINLPMDEFNDMLSRHELSEDQLNVCRDIRRRGKNKVRLERIACSLSFSESNSFLDVKSSRSTRNFQIQVKLS